MIDRGQSQGYAHSICLTCNNGGEIAHINHIRVQVCQALTAPAVLEDILLVFSEDADDDEKDFNFNTLFGNDDSTYCPLTCEILQEDCQTPLESEYFNLIENSKESWTLKT